MTIEGYQLKQCSDWYYLVPQPSRSCEGMIKKHDSMTSSHEMLDIDITRRESFPQPNPVILKSHRRAMSCTAVLSPHQHHMIASGDDTSQMSQPVSPSCSSSQTRPSISHFSSQGSLLSRGEGFSGYDASQSNSVTSLSATSVTADVRQCHPVTEGSVQRFWLLMHISDELVKVLFHTRCVLCMCTCACCVHVCVRACARVCACV